MKTQTLLLATVLALPFAAASYAREIEPEAMRNADAQRPTMEQMKQKMSERKGEWDKRKAEHRAKMDVMEEECHSKMQAASTPEQMKATREECKGKREAMHKEMKAKHEEMKGKRDAKREEMKGMRDEMKMKRDEMKGAAKAE